MPKNIKKTKIQKNFKKRKNTGKMNGKRIQVVKKTIQKIIIEMKRNV